MDMVIVSKRVAYLPKGLTRVLSLMVKGRSNRQIADDLRYAESSVGTMKWKIYRVLGITDIKSKMEKQQLAIEAFRLSNESLTVGREEAIISVSLTQQVAGELPRIAATIPSLSKALKDILSLVAQGLKNEAITKGSESSSRRHTTVSVDSTSIWASAGSPLIYKSGSSQRMPTSFTRLLRMRLHRPMQPRLRRKVHSNLFQQLMLIG